MDPIPESKRRVRNIHRDEFEPFVLDGAPCEGETVLQLDEQVPRGTGFHVYRMAPGATTTAHVHESDEHFLVLEGDLRDHDGYVYRPGDLVMLEQGTEHNSTTVGGCTLAVFLAAPETPLGCEPPSPEAHSAD